MKAEEMSDRYLISGARAMIEQSENGFLDDYGHSRVLQLAIRQLRIVERRHDSRFRGVAIDLIESVKKKP